MTSQTMNVRREPVLESFADTVPQAAHAAEAPARARTLAVLEVRERGRHLAQAVPITRWPCTLGRAAQADVVLTDPALAAEHVRLNVDDAGRVHAQVLDDVNGIWQGRRHLRGRQSFAWPTDKTLTVGHTQLALRLASAPLPAPRPWRPASWRGIAATVLAVLALMGWIAIETLLNMSVGGDAGQLVLSKILDVCQPLLVWVLLWMMASKLFSGFIVFGRHLRIAALGLLGFAGVTAVLHVLAFVFSWPVLARFDHSLAYCVLAATVWRHLCAATPLSRRVLAACMSALLALALALQLGQQWQSQKRLGQGTLYLSHLYPPDWRLVPARSVGDFIGAAQGLDADLAARVAEQAEKDGASDGSGNTAESGAAAP